MKYYYVGSRHQFPYFWPDLPRNVDDWLKLGTSAQDPDFEIVYRIQGGIRQGQVLGTLAWSTELVAVLGAYRASGYATYPVKVLRRGRRVRGFVGIRVYGQGGPFDPVRSEATFSRDGGLIGYARVCMDETKWDGSDVFTIPGLGIAIFVVEPLAKEIMKLRLKNVTLEEARECSLP